jgi:RNA polymerase sigma factor (sigma-70 family)
MRQQALIGSSAEDVAPPDAMPTDAELLARWCGSADRAALELLIRRHGGLVLGVCRRVLGNVPDADDAFQAVFLIFVRKAASLSRPEQVAGWLHGVALRVARRARADRARRHEREAPMVEPVAPVPPDDVGDLRRVLDEELERLPDKYRLPILLCDLEGMTLAEAARQLGWPKGTVAGRLSRGRELLRRRLTRRRLGYVLLLCPIGADEVPEQLVAATVEAAGGIAAAPKAAGLAAAVLRDWVRRKVSLGLVLILAAALLGASAWGAYAASVESRSPSPDDPSSAPTAPSCH